MKERNFFLRQIKNLKKEGHHYFSRIIKILIFSHLRKILVILVSIILMPISWICIRVFNIKMIEIDASRMGHLATHFEPYMREVYFKKSHEKNNYIVFFRGPISNRYLFKLYKNFISKNQKIISVPGYIFWKITSNLYKGIFSEIILEEIVVDDFYNDFHKNDCLFSIPDEDKNKGEKLLESLRIPSDAKIICVHNRDKLFLKKKFSDLNFSYHDFRDFSVNDMIPALNYFTEQGYYVLRFGAISEETLNVKNKKIIDYANKNEKDGFGDIFFNSKCDFYFGSDSGAWNISRLFRKPGFIINSCPLISIFVMKWNYPSIFKRIRNIKDGKILSLREMIKNNLHLIDRNDDLQNKGFEFISNTKEEILDLAKEAVIYVNKKNSNKNPEQNKKLNEFHSTLFESVSMQKRNFKNPIGHKFLENTSI